MPRGLEVQWVHECHVVTGICAPDDLCPRVLLAIAGRRLDAPDLRHEVPRSGVSSRRFGIAT